MRANLTVPVTILCTASMLLAPSVASAMLSQPTSVEPAPAPAPIVTEPAPPPEPVSEPEAEPEPVPPPADAGTIEPAPSVETKADVMLEGPEATLESNPQPETVPSALPEADPKWYDRITFGAFVDAYAQINYLFPSSQLSSAHGNENQVGFGLGWAGLDFGYDGDVAGATVQLRFGPRNYQYNIGTPTTDAGRPSYGLQYVKQAYATWKPRIAKGKLKFDLGKWDTLYGSEVGDVQNNMLYSWPFLFFYGQPFYHTGLRVSAQLSESFALTALVANGWNNTFDNNGGKTYGIQFGITPNGGEKFAMALGYITGPEGSARITPESTNVPLGPEYTDGIAVEDVNRRFRHFADLVLIGRPTDKLTLVFNGDFGTDQVVTNPINGDFDQVFWWGMAGTIGYSFTEQWAAAVRGDFLHDVSGFTTGVENLFLGSATVNIDYKPSPNLMLRFENRFDGASEEFFRRGTRSESKYQGMSTLALIVMLP